MNITTEQLNIALEIDRKFSELEQKSNNYLLILGEMSDLLLKFKKLMDELDPNGFDQLNLQFDGFYRFGEFLEWVAAQIESGEIKVPH